MIVKKALLLAVIITASVVMLNLPKSSSAVMPVVALNPSITHVDTGEHFFVNVTVADVQRLYSWQVNITFNPAVINFVNATEGDFLKTQAPEGTWTTAPIFDNTKGYSMFAWYILGSYIGPSGSGWLCSIELSVVGVGETLLGINNSDTKLIEYQPPPPPPGESLIKLIPHTNVDGFFTNLATPPHSEFTYLPIVPGIGQEITFNATASSATAPQVVTRLEWDFGDGSTRVFVRDVNLTYMTTHTYAEAGIYPVSLIVFDDTPASTLVQSVFGTAEMPRVWYELFSTYETTITLGLGHDIAVIDVKASKSRVTAGEGVTIDVKVLNKGTSTETFNVEAYYGSSVIATKKPVSNLVSAANQSVQFSWDTTNVPAGVYTIRAAAVDVADEAYTPDNSKTDGTVEVVAPGNDLPIMLIAGAVVVVIVVVVVAVLLLRRRKGA